MARKPRATTHRSSARFSARVRRNTCAASPGHRAMRAEAAADSADGRAMALNPIDLVLWANYCVARRGSFLGSMYVRVQGPLLFS